MLIKKYIDLTVKNDKAYLSEDIYLFRKDKNIDLVFTILNFNYKFIDVNTGEEKNPTYQSFKILKPNGEKITTKKEDFKNNVAVLSITHEMIDELEEVGEYKIQIQLLDDDNGCITIPYVNMYVLEPIFEGDYTTYDGQIDITAMGLSKIIDVPEDTRELYEWNTGDLISANRMNAIHENINNIWNQFGEIDAYDITYNDETVGDALERILDVGLEITSLKCDKATEIRFGETIQIPKFTWSLNRSDISYQAINDKVVASNLREYQYAGSITKNTTFTLVVNTLKHSAKKSINFKFMNDIYYGVYPSEKYDKMMLTSLQSRLQETRNCELHVNADGAQYVYYIYPKRLGEATFMVGGFEGGFEKITEVQITNSAKYSEVYYVYKSVNYNLGDTIIKIT